MMKTWIRYAASGAALVGLAAAPLGAQTANGGLGLFGSWMNPGTLAESGNTELQIDDGFGGGAGLEFWFGSGRFGLGLNGAYHQNSFQADFGENATPEEDEFGDVTNWYADASLMLRLLEPVQRRRFAPFLSLGAGWVRIDPDGNGTTNYEPADAQIQLEAQNEIAVVGAVGTDLFFSDNVALRVELKDYWTPDSPYDRISIPAESHEGGHNLQLNAGLQFFFGGGEEPTVFPREEPEPEPIEPEPAAEPEPEPVVEETLICVVDDDGDFELRTVDAFRVADEDRVFVRRNGQEVDLVRAYPATGPVYVRSARWYMDDEPLEIDFADVEDDELDEMIEDREQALEDALEEGDVERVEWVTFGTSRTFAPGELTFVGTVDGTPVYARTADVEPFRTDLRTAHMTTRDLDVILLENDELATHIVELDPVFVAVEPAENECVFRPLSPTNVVRATRGDG